MSLAVLVLGIAIFLLCLLLHILLWRSLRPQKHIPALLAIFFGAGALLVFLAASGLNLSHADAFAVLLLHVAISCGYIQLYPASQADSPSVIILSAVQDAMPQGLSESELQALIQTKNAFQGRVDDLVFSGLVADKNGTLSLTDRGRAFILPFMIYRRLLGIPEGKG
jgi:hypothetical protein